MTKTLSAPITVTTRRELRWFVSPTPEGKTPVTIPAGTKVQVCFIAEKPERLAILHESGQSLQSLLKYAHRSFTGFAKPPGQRTLEKYSDCIAKTPTGHKTEPDGYGPDGSPSWLLALGLI